MREKFKKGEIVSATKTFNGEIITGEFQGYRLFNDEIPDAVVGVVHVSGDRSYDVDVASIRHYENEDERIRKKLLKCCDSPVFEIQTGIKNEALRAWLEKQKEHNFANAYATVVKEGYVVLEKKDYEKLVGQKEQKSVENKDLSKCSEDIQEFMEIFCENQPKAYWDGVADTLEWIKEHPDNQFVPKPTEWHPEDEQNLNVCLSYIKDEPLRSWLIDAIHVRYDKPAEWSEKDIRKLNRITQILGEAGEVKCWYEKKRICEKEEADDLCAFLKSVFNRFDVKQPVEWSEEDEKMLDDIIRSLPKMAMGNIEMLPSKAEQYANRLKSFRSSWKPTEEQMNVLGRFLKFLHESGSPDFGLMDSLLGQLKKL